MQDIFNLLPNLNVEALVQSFFVKTNDMHLVVYLSSLIRSVIALHNLLGNKAKYKDYESKKTVLEPKPKKAPKEAAEDKPESKGESNKEKESKP